MCSDRDLSPIRVSIIILSKNGQRYLHSLLEGLYCQRGVDRYEVIVIDSGSADDTLSIVAKFPATRLIEIPPEEFGHGRTRNLGARMASGEFLVFLPQDATPVGDGWLAALLAPFANDVVAGVYARQLPRDDASPMEKFFLTRSYDATPRLRTLTVAEPVSLAGCFFSTVSGAIRAARWASHPFREDVIMSEDQAWSSDVMRAGWTIAYQPTATVLHSHQYGIKDIFRRNFDSGYSIRQIFDGVTGIRTGHALHSLASEAWYVASTSGVSQTLKFFPYEFARHAGFWLGLHGNWLPITMRKVCGNLTYFWDDDSATKSKVGHLL